MNQALTPEEFWEAFCDHNADLNKEELYYDVWQFLDGARGCDRLASLCLAGIKTATSSVYETFEIDDMKVPEEGDYSIILDSDEVPLFILKDTKVEIKTLVHLQLLSCIYSKMLLSISQKIGNMKKRRGWYVGKCTLK